MWTLLCRSTASIVAIVEDADDKLFEYALTNPEHSLNELLPDRQHELTYSLRPRRHDLTLLVVDHIAYLTAISLLGNSLKTAIDHLLQLHVT